MKSARTATVIALAFLALCFPSAVMSAELSAAAKAEIDHLLGYIEKSGCQFYRNGTWYADTKAAREHVELKYNYFAKKGRVNSTEDFIKWSATKSEISGKPYMVRIGSGSQMPVAQWLTEELARFRKGES